MGCGTGGLRGLIRCRRRSSGLLVLSRLGCRLKCCLSVLEEGDSLVIGLGLKLLLCVSLHVCGPAVGSIRIIRSRHRLRLLLGEPGVVLGLLGLFYQLFELGLLGRLLIGLERLLIEGLSLRVVRLGPRSLSVLGGLLGSLPGGDGPGAKRFVLPLDCCQAIPRGVGPFLG